MDVNGTRFHLLRGADDWRACRDEAAGGEWVNLSLEGNSVTLKPQLMLFLNGKGRAPLDLAARRGAAADDYGTWFWVGQDRFTLWWRPSGSQRSLPFWPAEEGTRERVAGEFAPAAEGSGAATLLAGLAVTEHHYLVAGFVEERGGKRRGGLFVFDLHAGGGPLRLVFPDGIEFEPFDLAAAPGGGFWVLDRANSAYWGFDRQFRVVGESSLMRETEAEERWTFREEGREQTIVPARRFPIGFPLTKGEVGAEVAITAAVAIEALPGGDVLVLESPAFDDSGAEPPPVSIVHRYRLSRRLASVELRDEERETAGAAGREGETVSVAAFDFALATAPAVGAFGAAHAAHTAGGAGSVEAVRLYAVEREGNQVVAFDLGLDSDGLGLRAGHEFLPLHYFGSRSLVAHGGELFYDVVGGDPTRDRAVRWLRLREVEQPRYEREGSLTTPPLDGKEPGCVWHRLFLDACVPAESSVEVWTRAHDDRELLRSLPFAREPAPYLRGAGSELPFLRAQAAPGARADEGPGGAAGGAGTWELLFQQARGRFLQIRLAFAGTGRVSPSVGALRAYYPRFSYPRQYLPAAFLEDDESRSFLERFLANQEGFFTEIEGKVSDVSLLFDARTAPAETLDWLASWVGLMLDPLWSRLGQRRASDGSAAGAVSSAVGGPVGLLHAASGADRRRLFIRFARRLYDRRGTRRGMLFALNLLLDPTLEATLARLKAAAVRPGEFPALLAELDELGLARPRPSTTEREYENTLYEYVLAPSRPSKVRVVESFRTRGGRGMVEGLPDSAERVPGGTDAEAGQAALIADPAHAFTVLVPEALTDEEEAMVVRVVALEKPAHTRFDVRRYWDYFRVGETRLGIDTTLGESARFRPFVLGANHLAGGYLHPPRPRDLAGRVVADRPGRWAPL
ncbi:MAG TPA: hypothetical protein VEY09_06080 [Pyrinomonadaceae bacterium]|nr:hypothetical protein [Pyrinomonadaceae bacterium]